MMLGRGSRHTLSCVLFLAGAPAGAASLTSAPFGTATDDTPITRYVMTTNGGVSVSFMNYGGIITDVVTPDRQGRVPRQQSWPVRDR